MSFQYGYHNGKAFKCCYKCTERHVGCHGSCKRYNDEIEEHNKKKKQIQQERMKEGAILDYGIQSTRKMKSSMSRVPGRCRKK